MTLNNNNNNIFKKHKLLLIVLPICLFAAWAILCQYKPLLYIKMDELRLLPVKERFTELYFDDPSAILSAVAANGIINFSFAINNLEGLDKEYLYAVYFMPKSGNIKIIDQNNIFVKDKERRVVKESYDILSGGIDGRIFVELPELSQKIHFVFKN